MARYKDPKDWKAKGGKRINPKHAKDYNIEFSEIAKKLIATGSTQNDVAFFLGTTLSNLKKWKKQYPEFKRAINKGHELTLTYLLSKGFTQSCDRKIKDTTVEYIANVNENGHIVKVVGETRAKIKESERHIPGDNRLLMFLISSLERSLGRDVYINRQFIESKKEETITHKIDAEAVQNQIDKLRGNLTKQVESVEVEHKKIGPSVPKLSKTEQVESDETSQV